MLEKKLSFLFILFFCLISFSNFAFSKDKILFILTSSDKIKLSNSYVSKNHSLDKSYWLYNTGYYGPELVEPYEFLIKDFDIDIASSKGGTPPVDQRETSLTEKVKEFIESHPDKLNTLKIGDPKVKIDPYEAIFIVGGHGVMDTDDLTNNPAFQTLVKNALEQKKIVAAVCHGPGALLNVTYENGESILKGQRVTGFSNDEENIVLSYAPYSLENDLKERAGDQLLYTKAKNLWGAHVEVNKYLLFGQNPASSLLLAEKLKQAIFFNKSLR
jgi:putative intracellular protease/amidase